MNNQRRRRLFCTLGGICALLLALALLYKGAEKGETVSLRLSAPSGFYDEPFALEMDAGGMEIRYTLDSTLPDENSTLYTGPIAIEDASANENVYSMIPDVCLTLKPEILESTGKSSPFEFTLPDGLVDKATVVRAVSVDPFGNCSAPVTAVYFVGFNQKSGYDGMNVISITTEPENLFDYDRGIYVLGKSFDKKLLDGMVVEELDPNVGSWPGNYKNWGIRWEREASVCFFDADRKLVLSGDYGIRIQGGASRYMLPKSLNLFARGDYDSAPIPGKALFGENWQLHSLNLNAGGQGVYTKIHDFLSNTLLSDTHVLTREYKPYVLFLDGEYWGVYWLTPRFKPDYFESKYHIREDDLIVTKVSHIEAGYAEDIEAYETLTHFIGDADLNDPNVYEQFCALVDVDNWVDYYAIEIYLANVDWPKNNASMFCTRRNTGQPMCDGRWRWILFDVNLAMNLKNAEMDFVQRTARRDATFACLLDCKAFQEALYTRLVKLANEELSPERVNAFVDEYEARMSAPMAREYRRFVSSRTENDFIHSCEEIRQFFQTRHDYILKKYGEKYA